MTAARARVGLLSGIIGLLPLALVIGLTRSEVLTGSTATLAALIAFPASLLLGGGCAGYLAGQRRRKRSEAKAAVGGIAGIFAALAYFVTLDGIFLIRVFTTPVQLRNALDIHPIRVSFAILLLSALQVVIAMLAATLTARPLPPPRNSRRLTSQMRAVPPQMTGQFQTPPQYQRDRYSRPGG